MKTKDTFKNKTCLEDIAKDINAGFDTLVCAVYAVKADMDLTLLYGNSAFYRLLGCTPEEMTYRYGSRLGVFLDPGVLNEIWDNSGLSAGASTRCEYPILRRDGTSAWLCCSLSKRVLPDGREYFFCIAFDDSVHHQTCAELSYFKEMIDVLTDQTSFELFLMDMSTGYARLLATHSLLSGLTEEYQASEGGFCHAFLKQNFLFPEFETMFLNLFKDLENTCDKSAGELHLLKKDGTDCWYLMTLTKWKFTSSKSSFIIGTFENITWQKEASLNYLTENQFFHSLLSQKEAYGQVNVDENKILSVGGIWNLYNELLDTVSYSDLIQEFINKVVYPEDREHYLETMQCENFLNSFSNGIDKLSCEFRRIVQQNKMVWMRIQIHLIREPVHGKILALLYLEDIDKIKLQTISSHSEENFSRLIKSASLDFNPEKSPGFLSPLDEFMVQEGDMAYLVDPDSYLLIYGNEAFYSRIGRTRQDCAGLKCYEIIQNRITPCPFCSKANWSTDKFYIWKNMNHFLEQEFLIKNKLVTWNGKQLMLALAVDISNDKSIVDSLENNTSETHCILAGIEQMSSAADLDAVIYSFLETIGTFFRASSVRLWRSDEMAEKYTCRHFWEASGEKTFTATPSELDAVSEWVMSRTWNQPIIIESPNAMLYNSYNMYQFMQKHEIRNSRWFKIIVREKEFGYAAIHNITVNFQNSAFLESFSKFISDELTKRIAIEEVIWSNNYDSMTGLLSRNSYESYIRYYEEDSLSSLGVISIDLDNLSGINSNQGFHVGDFYIKQLANILKEAASTYNVYRLNGDEFLIIAENISYHDLNELVSKIRDTVADRCQFTITLGFSWDDIEKDLAKSVERATQIMRINKKRFYDASHSTKDKNRHDALHELLTSIENHKYKVFLQPKLDFVSNRITGAEALIRYQHETAGIIPPVRFIEPLEKNNLIRYVDLFVLEEVCRLLETWKREQRDLPVISLNFSRLTLMEEDILYSVDEIVSQYDVSKDHLEIEVTESLADMGKSTVYNVLKELHLAGYKIALDDFGIKYANLAILSDLAIDVLKLDKSLINDLVDRRANQVILKNIISMCSDLQISVIAEGVETEVQEHLLKELGCNMGQGYLYGRPVPIPQFESDYL